MACSRYDSFRDRVRCSGVALHILSRVENGKSDGSVYSLRPITDDRLSVCVYVVLLELVYSGVL